MSAVGRLQTQNEVGGEAMPCIMPVELLHSMCLSVTIALFVCRQAMQESVQCSETVLGSCVHSCGRRILQLAPALGGNLHELCSYSLCMNNAASLRGLT